MKKRTLKMLLTIICVLAAGICYSCSSQDGWTQDSRQVLEFSQETLQELNAEESVEAGIPGERTGTEWTNRESAASQPTTDTETAVTLSNLARYYVHICGAVKCPGVYEMEQGERVFQVVERAGGFTDDADEGYLNLALEVEDGMKVVVPSEAATKDEKLGNAENGRPADGEVTENETAGIYRSDGTLVGTVSGSTTESAIVSEAGDSQKVNLNTAAREELMTLNGIGQAKADDIIRYREKYGPFLTIEDIKKVSGIKDAAFQKIKDDITV